MQWPGQSLEDAQQCMDVPPFHYDVWGHSALAGTAKCMEWLLCLSYHGDWVAKAHLMMYGCMPPAFRLEVEQLADKHILTSDNPEVLYNYGTFLYLIGRYSEAHHAWEQSNTDAARIALAYDINTVEEWLPLQHLWQAQCWLAYLQKDASTLQSLAHARYGHERNMILWVRALVTETFEDFYEVALQGDEMATHIISYMYQQQCTEQQLKNMARTQTPSGIQMYRDWCRCQGRFLEALVWDIQLARCKIPSN